MSRESAANTGKRIALSTGMPVGGVVTVIDHTQLLSARMDRARQWVITMMQPVTGRSGVNPWGSPFDGLPGYPPVPPLFNTAPILPIGTALQVVLRWGAGGVAFNTRFDYPMAGGTFGVTGDNLDMAIAFRGTAPSYGDILDVPIVGAFMVEGQSTDPTPLKWRELDPTLATGFIAIANGGDAFWGVKPFARRVHLTSGDVTARYHVNFLDAAGGTLHDERVNLATTGTDRTFTIPACAAVMRIVNNGAAPSAWSVEWEIGLT